jgi:hypothetical protein
MAFWLTNIVEATGHIDGDPSQPMLILEDLGERCGGAQVVKDPSLFSERQEHIAQV